MCSFEYSPKYVALAQLRNLLSHRQSLSSESETSNYSETTKLLERLTKRGLDLDYAVPSDAPVAEHAPELVGCTALHFAAETSDKQIVDYFIRHGAKITTVNELAYSPIRLALQRNIFSNRWPIRELANTTVLDMLLNGQYNQNDAANPSCKKGISHLHIACMVDNARMVEFLLRSGASTDAAISQDSREMAGFRPLHVAVYYRSADSFKVLLKSGADLWAREARGLNPLQLLIECNLKLADITELQVSSNIEFSLNENYLANDVMANSMLDHRAGNFYDEYGFNWLHLAASMRDDTMLVDLLKNNPGINVNAAISASSPQYPGYTPLHFAARSGFKTVILLVKKGANLLIADAHGTTPFDICATRYNPKILYEIMQFDETLKNITFKTSPLVTLCEAIKALRSKEHMHEFLYKMSHVDDPVSSDSPLWPGYSLLHLVVAIGHQRYDMNYQQQLCYEFGCDGILMIHRRNKFMHEIGILRYLTEIGASPLAQDVQNSTPVHLAFRRSNTDAVKHLLHQLTNKFKRFDNITDLDGLSLLHISAAGSFNDVAVSLLQNNADVNIRTISKFMRNNTECYFPPRSTPLHFAVATNSIITALLIQKGAEFLAVDADGFTPALRAFIREVVCSESPRNSRMISGFYALFAKMTKSETNVVSIAGLSHLHVACWWNCDAAVKTFLDHGADVNAKIINCDLDDLNSKSTWTHYLMELLLKKYADYTPLHFAVEFEAFDTIELLMESGADLHARNARGFSPMHMALMSDSDYAYKIIQCLLANVDKSNGKPVDDYGITLLHVACRFKDEVWVKKLLHRGIDVNAQIAMHSPIWPGDTPLHVFTGILNTINEENGFEIAQLLIAHGADITLSNAEKNTPLQILTMYLFRHLGRESELWDIYLKNTLSYYVINRINKDGLSLFHIACIANNIKMVEKLSLHGADVNQLVDYFVGSIGGCRPLHFLIRARSPIMLQLLIKKGANLNVKDMDGRTIFHYFCENFEKYSYFERMILTFCNHGLDINARDLTGVSPLQFLLERYSKENKNERVHGKREVCLLKCGARLNRLDSSMSYLIKAAVRGLPVHFLYSVDDTDILAVMDDGSTAIHNSVRGIYCIESFDDKEIVNSGVIELLMSRGCSINAQDNRGRTALHVALDCKNIQGVYELLEAGIDPNIVDNDGKSYWDVNRVKKMDDILVNYLHKFILLGLEMSESNRRQYSAVHHQVSSSLHKAKEELKLITELKEPIGGFLLSEILSDRIFSKFETTSQENRKDILQILASFELRRKFCYFRGPIRYQYQRLLERMNFVESTKDVKM